MVKADAIEGIVNGALRFHYDLAADVLYLRLLSAEGAATVGDLTDEGDLLLRDEQSGRAVGLTLVSWWKRFGQGAVPDSMVELSRRIEPFASRVAA